MCLQRHIHAECAQTKFAKLSQVASFSFDKADKARRLSPTVLENSDPESADVLPLMAWQNERNAGQQSPQVVLTIRENH